MLLSTRLRSWPQRLGLLAGLAALAPAAHAQTPTAIYAIGNAAASGAQYVTTLNPAAPVITDPSQLIALSGLVSPTQRLVGLDVRPNTGVLYALGYDASLTTNNAQLYTLVPATGVLTPVGGLLTLNLQDNNRANTQGYITNVGFDFNPRVDRIRVVAPNGTNYRLNPNGSLTAQDGNLNYATSGNAVPPPAATPYIGTAAYTNSSIGLSGTTLYDIDETNTNAVLSIQAPPNAGTLTTQNTVTFSTNGNPPFYSLNSPTIALDVDFYYNRTTSQNTAYLLEARFSDKNNVDPSQGFASNLFILNTSTGQATGNNIVGKVAFYLSNLAVAINMPLTWNGSVSTAWNNPANWTPNRVPTATDDVFIPGPTPNQPTVSDQEQALSVTLGSNAVLTTANGGLLNVSGNFFNNDGSVAGSGNGTVAFVGTTQQEISGPSLSNFHNLTISGSGGAFTSGPISVERALTVSNALAIGAGQPFTLLSTSAGTAYLVNTGSGIVTGTATVQRYITPTNPGLGYRHYSSPVSGNTVADFATTGYSPVVNPAYNSATNPRQTNPYPTVFYYNQSRLATSNAAYAVGDFDNGFLSPNALSDALVTGQGYTVNIGGGEQVDFQGTLNQASSYARTGLGRGAQTAAGYQLLGNPYPGALNYDVLVTNTTGMESALYVYKSNGQYTGTYTTYVPAGATNGGPGVSANGGTSNIPLAQGFFMRTAAGQTGSVTFTTAARTNAPETALFQRTASTLSTLALTLSGNGAANQTRVYFDQQATSAFDAKYDAHYLPATHGLDLASDISTEALAINGLPELTGTVTVPLRVHAPAAGTYTLAVDELNNLPTGYHAYLRDATTGTYTDLAATPSLSLNLSATDPATGRYAIVFSANAPLATASATLSALAALYPSPAHGTATLILPQALRGTSASTVQILNSLGQVVLSKTMAGGGAPSLELPLSGLAPGIYTVQATTAAGLVAKRLVVQ